jgi:hypothetical protein
MRTTGIALIAGTACAVWAAPLRAQAGDAAGDWTAPAWVGDVTFLGLNALSSGVTAGVFQKLRGESFADGFARGALGGSVYYAGLRTSAQRFDGAGLLGRQIAAAGTSMVRNAADGRPMLERLFVPLGPLHLYVDLADGVAVRPKVNVTALALLLSAAAEPQLEWDAAETLSAGAPVFRVRDRRLVNGDRAVGGYVRGGVIFVSDGPPERDARILAHERVHVLQGDWLFHTWSDPAESWLMNRVPLGGTMYRYLDLAIVAPVLGSAAYDLFDVSDRHRLYEIEAYFLDGR